MEIIPGLTQKQRKFIQLFPIVFNIRNAKGALSPFYPELFQQQVIADSMICAPQVQNRIINKGRGIGLTALIAGEIVLAATIMPKIKIPVASISARTANVLIDWCIDLIDNSNDLSEKMGGISKITRDKKIDSMVKLMNGSQIIPISGGNPESIRSLRAPILVLDEFAFNEYQKEILTAGERCLSEAGQITIISTPKTTDTINDEYWRIWMKGEELGYKKYKFPIFDPEKLDIHKSLLEQNLKPIAPWLDLKSLEDARSRDELMFSRENLCRPLDESVAFLSWNLIKKCCVLKPSAPIPNYPIYAGVDVGRTHDNTVIEIFQKINNVFYHLEEVAFRSLDIPRQVIELSVLDSKYGFSKIHVDSTGMGLGLFEFAKKNIGSKVKGINFTREIKTELAINLRTMMQDEKIFLLNHDALVNDIHSVPYDTLNAARTSDGHSDRFWAICLGISKDKGRILDAGALLDKFL